MTTSLENSRQDDSVITIEQLSNEIHLQILKQLSMYDWYNIFFGMNSRFNSLVHCITPKIPNFRALNHDIRTFEHHFRWLFNDFIWWEESAYYLIPQQGCYALRWKFVPQKNIEQLKEESEIYRRILPVISKYPIRVNTLFLLFSVYNIKHLYFLCNEFSTWLKDNYNEQHEIIIESDKRWYTEEVCNAFREINKLEKEKQEKMIVEQAKKIWDELRESEQFLIPYLPAFPSQK